MENYSEIPDTQGRYLINRAGDVYSLKTNRSLKLSKGNSGYSQVALRIANKTQTHMIHRLVAKTFLPNPQGFRVVNHVDGNKLNNAADNLQWCSHSDNSIHANRTGLTQAPPKWTGRFGADHNRSIPIYSYDAKGNFLAAYGGINDAGRQLGIQGSTIGHALKSGAFSRLARCFFFYEKQTKAQVLQARKKVQAKLDKRGDGNRRPVWACTPEGKVLAEFAGMDAAAKAYGITAHNVVDSIRFNRINTKSGIRFAKIKPSE